jgi:hypothetical protein
MCVIYKPSDMSHTLLSSAEADVDYAIITHPTIHKFYFSNTKQLRVSATSSSHHQTVNIRKCKWSIM